RLAASLIPTKRSASMIWLSDRPLPESQNGEAPRRALASLSAGPSHTSRAFIRTFRDGRTLPSIGKRAFFPPPANKHFETVLDPTGSGGASRAPELFFRLVGASRDSITSQDGWEFGPPRKRNVTSEPH